jgi:iron complex outermembrane receptor protein
LSWRLGAQQDFAKGFMGYVTVSTGYKAPQIADALRARTSADTDPWHGGMFAIAPELPTNYEIGLKTSLLDNRLAVDADVFYEDVKNYQGQYSFPNGQGTITSVPASVPKVVSKGVELDVFGRPWNGMSLNVSGIYNPAKYPAHYLSSDGSDLGGNQLNYGSKVKVTMSAEQEFVVSAGYTLVAGADATYRSEQSLYLSAQPQFVQPAGTIYNARLGVRSGSGWSLYAFGRNLGREEFPRQLYPTPFQSGGLWQVLDASSKKLVGLQLEAKF